MCGTLVFFQSFFISLTLVLIFIDTREWVWWSAGMTRAHSGCTTCPPWSRCLKTPFIMDDGATKSLKYPKHGFVPDLPGANQESGGPYHQVDVAGVAGRPPREQQEGVWAITFVYLLDSLQYVSILKLFFDIQLNPSSRFHWIGTTSSSTRCPICLPT